jgi:hypothetical protein
VRKVWVAWIAVEGKLQDASTGNAELIEQSPHVGRDDSQVFGEKGQRAQFTLDRLK